jgi:hypothetical protein
VDESKRQNLGQSQKSFALKKAGGEGFQQKPQAAPQMTWVLTPATVAGARPLPSTYRVRFVLRVVAPEASTAGEALGDSALQPAKPAESRPAAPAAAPAAAPSKER